MMIRFFDYRNEHDYERAKENNFDSVYAECYSDWKNPDNISIFNIEESGKFRVAFDSTGNNRWWVGCQRLFAIINENREEIYRSPYDNISINDRSPEELERVVKVREDLLALEANGWKPVPDEERAIKNYIEDCDNAYMPDIF